MDLVLWRHADAIGGQDQDDAEGRALSPKGRQQAQRMARWLNHALPAGARILVSPSLQAQQTAEALDRKFKTCAALAPLGTLAELLDAARWPVSREPVLVVGHQPALGLAVAHLVSGEAAPQVPWRIKKGGVWWLRQREGTGGRSELTVIDVRSPETL